MTIHYFAGTTLAHPLLVIVSPPSPTTSHYFTAATRHHWRPNITKFPLPINNDSLAKIFLKITIMSYTFATNNSNSKSILNLFATMHQTPSTFFLESRNIFHSQIKLHLQLKQTLLNDLLLANLHLFGWIYLQLCF